MVELQIVDLKSNFQRNWKYSYNELNDQHVFFLDEKPLGAQ